MPQRDLRKNRKDRHDPPEARAPFKQTRWLQRTEGMKLTAKNDVEAPVDFVFAQLADFEGWERAAMRRGAEVARLDSMTRVGPGMTWSALFQYRGKERKTTIRLDAIKPTSSLSLTGMSRLMDGVMVINVLDLAAKRTRVEVRLDIKPKTIAARLLIQSLRLARARVERRFSQRVAQMSIEIEDRFRKSQRG